MAIIRTRIIAAALIAFTTPVFALNLSFMNSGPANYFSGDDFKIMESTADNVLNKAKDGRKVVWRNPNTSTWGYFIPFNTHSENGNTCRNLKIFESASSVTNLATYKFCKINNTWQAAN